MPTNPHIPPIGARVVELLVFSDVQLLDVAGPLQVFASANERAAEQGVQRPYDVRVVAPADSVGSTAGLTFLTAPLSSPSAPLDTLMVAGGSGVMRAAEDSEIVDWISRRASAARRVASVCTGAFLLGAQRGC